MADCRGATFELFEKNNRGPGIDARLHQSCNGAVPGDEDAIFEDRKGQNLHQGQISGADLHGMNRIIPSSSHLFDHSFREKRVGQNLECHDYRGISCKVSRKRSTSPPLL